MSWLLEDSLFVVIIGLAISALLAGCWLQTGNRPVAYALAIVVGLTGSLVLLERTVETERERIEATLHQAARYVEEDDLEAVLRVVHPSASTIRERAAAEFARFDFERVKIKQNLEIFVEEDEATATFNVVLVLSQKTGVTRQPSGLRDEIRVPQFVTLKLRKAGDAWQILQLNAQPPQVGLQKDR